MVNGFAKLEYIDKLLLYWYEKYLSSLIISIGNYLFYISNIREAALIKFLRYSDEFHILSRNFLYSSRVLFFELVAAE